MRQVSQSYRTGKLALVDTAAPRAPAGGVLVDTTVSLISAGTERAIVDMARKNLLAKAKDRPDLVAKVIDKAKREGVLAAFDAVRTKLDNPIPLGYSLAGRVAAVGAGTQGFARGDRVACAGAGFANHAEINAVPLNLVVPVPDAVTDEEAAFVTVGAIALHGVRLARPTLGASVVVIGLGLLGQIAVQLLAAHGCDVIGVDIDPAKVERAKARGAVAGAVPTSEDPIEVVRAHTRGLGADAVVITASSPTNEPLVTAGEMARDRARVVMVGLMPLEVPRKTYFDKELELVVSRSYGPGRYDPEYEERGRDYPVGYVRWTERRNFEAVLRAIETKRLDVKSLVTHRFAFEDALDAYAVVTGERPEPHLGVLLTYPAERAERTEGATNGAGAAAGAPAPHVRRDRSSLGVAMVGTGAFATSVLLPALGKVSGAKLVATVSGRGLSARHAADRFGAAHVLSDLDAALALPEVDAVVIATRHAGHAAQAAKALAAGRDVFLEKPAAIDEAQLAALAEAVAGAKGRLQLGFNRRFAPFAVAVREAFAGRRAGLVMVARINAGRIPGTSWIADAAESGGRIVGEGCHFVDLMSYWAGAAPVRASAHGLGAEGAYRRDDNVIATLSFADGSVGTLIYTAMGDPSVPKESYEVFCEGKVAQISDWRALSVTERGKTRTTRALKADKGHAAQLEAFVRACNGEGPSPIPWASIEATTRATFAIEQARVENVGVEF
ncbi:oxidoreductase [Sorangium cellulosum]|uniref:Oxidoreductase n=1 Tax=Sorangium cellulosum TaxID=56 RepID=A0A2L0EPJ2_SORCE|nr:bi-domain-containing oxidoreductase [Sorangium cellulosum]AUX41206.1 oxidoreductase [Sorangium cellulosum]